MVEVRERIAAASRRAGRDPAAVTLVGVAKLQPAEAVRAVVAAGVLDLGENRAQALRDRAAEGHGGVRWHAIGTVQRNKARLVAELASCLHALDRAEVAEALARARPPGDPLPVYLQVNVAGEGTKAGVAPAGIGPLVEVVRGLPSLRLVGLMTMPPYATGPDANRRHFAALRLLAADHGLDGLSMGTSDDYEVAVEEGATAVRVGRGLFGARPLN